MTEPFSADLFLARQKAGDDLAIARRKLREATDEYEKARQAYEDAWKAHRQARESEVGA